MKKQIHPNWFINVPVVYEGKIIAYTESTCEYLIVKAWSQTHPNYYKNQTQSSVSIKPKNTFITKYINNFFKI